MTEPRYVTLAIDGRHVRVPAGTNVVDAAHDVGIDIPVFCHHPRLEPVGMCRMCLVEIGTPVVDQPTGEARLDADGRPVIRMFPSLATACTTAVTEGMVVRTTSDAVAEARRGMLEFLLTSHPLDCPICDKGGECALQNQTMRYGPGRSRFDWGDKYRFPKPIPLGPLVALDRERCVLCARCIRFQDEIAGDGVLGFENRGRGMEIVSFSDPPFRSYFSLNTTDICPVGALTSVDFRFQARAWELVGRPGVCAHCAVGCNVMYDTRHGSVKRVMPRENDAVNELWLCDKGRLAYAGIRAPDRLTTPLVRRGGELVPASWDDAIGLVSERMLAIRAAHGPEAIGGVAGPGEPNEDLYMFGRFLRAVIGTNNVDHVHGIVRDDVLTRAGAGVRVRSPEESLRLTDIGDDTTVLVVGLDVEEEAPVLSLNLRKAQRRGARLVIVSGRPQKLDALAVGTLRWRYGAQGALLAALVGAVLRSYDAPPDEPAARSEQRSALARALAQAPVPHDVGVVPRNAVVIRDAEPVDAPPATSRPDVDALQWRHAGEVPDVGAAAEAIATAANLLVVYGQEAVEAGLVPLLAAMAAAIGRDGTARSGLLAVGRHANAQGAADMGLLPGWLPGYEPVTDARARARLADVWPGVPSGSPGADAPAMLSGGVRGLYVLGADPVGDDPRCADALDGLELLVVQGTTLTATAARADVVLPGQSVPEREGTFTNAGRRVQLFQAAATTVGAARPGWQVLRDLGRRFGHAEAFSGPSDVMAEIAHVAPPYSGVSYAVLGGSGRFAPDDVLLPFAPRTLARSVSYQGTVYENPLGEGAVWPVAPDEERSDAESEAALHDEGAGARGLAATTAQIAPIVPVATAQIAPIVPAATAQIPPTVPVATAQIPPIVPATTAQIAPIVPVATDGEAELILVPSVCLYTARGPMRHSPALAVLVRTPYVEMCRDDAEALDLVDGDAVHVATASGSAAATLCVVEGVTRGVVQAPEGLAWDPSLVVLLGGARHTSVRVTKAGT